MHGLLPIYVRTWREKICFYSTVMAILGACLIIFGALALAEKHTEQDILEFLTHMWEERDNPAERDEAEQFWDKVQIEYTCCGLNSFYTYNTTPKSCCAIDVKTCTNENAHKVYCFDAITNYYRTVLLAILAAGAFTMSFLCFVVIFVAHVSLRLFGLMNVSEINSVL